MIKLFCFQSVQPLPLANIETRSMRATYNEGADSAESGDALARTVVELDLDDVLRGLFQS